MNATPTPDPHPLRRLMAGITEHAFLTQVGLADPPLIDYVTDLLSRFIHVDAMYRLRDSAGRPMTELVQMAVEAEKLPPDGRTAREYHRHIGDFALFWSGVFPEAVNRAQAMPSRDHLVSFATLGKRSYRIAGECECGRREPESAVLRRLGHEFELCALGLHKVREEWDEMVKHPTGDGRLVK
jgi:hypothetical protein